MTYGNGTVDGHTAFGVNWPGVDCYVTTGGGLNYFQLLIIDRSDIAPGGFRHRVQLQQHRRGTVARRAAVTPAVWAVLQRRLAIPTVRPTPWS